MSTCSIFDSGNDDPKKAGGSFKMGDAFFDADGKKVAHCTKEQAIDNTKQSDSRKKLSYRDRILISQKGVDK